MGYSRCVAALVVCVVALAVSIGSSADEPARKGERTAIHVGTPPDVVQRMLEVARVTSRDVVYDLGCGDGRIVIAAAARYQCQAVGFEIDPDVVAEARANVARRGVEKLVRIEQRDIFRVDLRPASVVTLYLLPEMNVQLLPQLERMRAGARIVAHDFGIDGVTPDQHLTMISRENQVPRDIFLYTLPLKKPPQPAAD
ncbi:MAG: methyltransferase domain-containing protein [Pirellulaceae bacterium]